MDRNKDRKAREGGFSLIELMVTLVTVAVIMAIAIPMMREALVKAMIGAATAEARTIHHALKRYHIDQGGYPDSGGFDTHEPNVRFLVSDSNDGPLSGGTFHDGIVMYRNGVLTPL